MFIMFFLKPAWMNKNDSKAEIAVQKINDRKNSIAENNAPCLCFVIHENALKVNGNP
jgi:hypothetical protein